MNYLLDIVNKTQSKLDAQVDEFNKLRDRIMIVAGFATGLLTAIFSFWDNFDRPFSHFITGAIVISFISIAVLVFATFSNPLSRGMNADKLAELTEYGDSSGEEFYLSEIAYNLDSFKDNVPLLRKLQKKLNLCLMAQALIVLIIGIAVFLNSI